MNTNLVQEYVTEENKVEGLLGKGVVMNIPLERIRPNPYQPRKVFNRTALQELADSIREYGVLQPISVRMMPGGMYELIAGERRLKAAKMAKRSELPAVVYQINDNDSAILALIENLQREDLSYMEEAEGYHSLVVDHGITQEEVAKRVGKSQSSIANKIRLLKLPPLVKKQLSDNYLSERHARALLRLPDEQLQLKVLKIIIEREYNVQKSEELVNRTLEKYIRPCKDKPFGKSEMAIEKEKSGKVKYVIKDIKIFINTIRETISMLKRSGVTAKAAQFDRGDYYEFIIRIPKEENGIPQV